jgi:hypothetical protein
LDGSLGVEPRSVWIAIADGLCDLGEIRFGRTPPSLGKAGVPLLNYTLAFALQLRKSTENLSQGSRVVGDYSLRRVGRLFRDSLGWSCFPAQTLVFIPTAAYVRRRLK